MNNNNATRQNQEGHVTDVTVSPMNQFDLLNFFFWGRGYLLFSSKTISVLFAIRRGDLEETI